MFDNFLIQKRKTVWKMGADKDGNVIGLEILQFVMQIIVEVYLSLHNGYYIKVDGVQYQRKMCEHLKSMAGSREL